MNSLVVFDSEFGNTEEVARTIGKRLEAVGIVRIVSASESASGILAGVDLLVIGGPTQAHGPRPTLRAWIDAAPPETLRGMAVATFDTRLRWPVFLSGSAARTAAKSLRRLGARLVVPPESFFVNGTEGPLDDGELDRAAAWAGTLVRTLAAPEGALP